MHYSVIFKVLGIMRGINCVANVVVKFKSGYFEQSYRKNRIFHAEISYTTVLCSETSAEATKRFHSLDFKIKIIGPRYRHFAAIFQRKIEFTSY